MCRAAHSWYLRNTYVENNLIEPGKVTLKGQPIDLGLIKQVVYAVGAEKDHIVPWKAAWRITQLLKSDVRYVLASSGHIAGIINPPGGKGTTGSTSPASRPPQRKNGARVQRHTREAGGPTDSLGWPSIPGGRSSRRRWAARNIPFSRMPQAATCWKSDPSGKMAHNDGGACGRVWQNDFEIPSGPPLALTNKVQSLPLKARGY
jgi:hypothetical protein